jgi:hypothetical protein
MIRTLARLPALPFGVKQAAERQARATPAAIAVGMEGATDTTAKISTGPPFFWLTQVPYKAAVKDSSACEAGGMTEWIHPLDFFALVGSQ